MSKHARHEHRFDACKVCDYPLKSHPGIVIDCNGERCGFCESPMDVAPPDRHAVERTVKDTVNAEGIEA